MDRQQIHDRIVERLRALSESAQNITEASHLRDDLGLNSLDAVDLVMQLEDEFELELTDDELSGFETVGDVVNAIAGKV
jgi:acyl carrier protein